MIRRLAALRSHWLGIVGAVVFWCLLWGNFSASDVIGGLAAALLVFVLFPLPPVGGELTLRPVAALWFLVRFVADVIVSSFQVAWYALRPAGAPKCSVVAIRTRSHSDLFLTFTGMVCTLIPGSIVVEAQRSTGTLFLHVIGAETEEDADQARRAALDVERRLLRAFGRRAVLEEAGLA